MFSFLKATRQRIGSRPTALPKASPQQLHYRRESRNTGVKGIFPDADKPGCSELKEVRDALAKQKN